jgi:Ca-activated chloride channel homolog
MDMTKTSATIGTATPVTAGLVSVDGRTYPLKSARIDARAEGGIAATRFTQTYSNPYQEALEVMYVLPLPASGAVTGYLIRLGERIIRGEVRRREEAKEEYRKAMLEGRTAALLEQDRSDTFTQKLGCLPPGETAEIEIEVLQPLVFLGALGADPPKWEYRFPTVAGVRYEGAPGRVSDAEKLDVDRAGGDGIPVRLDVRMLIADGSAGATQPQFPGHEIDIQDQDCGALVALRDKMKLDRDLILRWNAATPEADVRLVEGKGLAGDDGRYVLITLTPPAAVSKGLSRDLTILIDASGSMSGKPLQRAKEVAEELIRSLDPDDRFQLLAFADRVQRLVDKPVVASEKNVRAALTALGRLEAGGGTEMTRALVEALTPLRPDSQRQVILISDGYIGFESEVIGEIMRRPARGARLHAVGIGAAPNRTLTRGAARAGRGVEILVGDDADARTASRRLLKATVRPILTEVEVRGTALLAQAPARPLDVMEAQPLVLLAEIAAAGGSLEVCGELAGKRGAWKHKFDLPPAGGAAGSGTAVTTLPLGALFGREAVEDVEMQLAAAGRSRESALLEARIESLGLRHRIASRKTSLIAIAENPTVDPKDPRRRERLAVEVPAEVSAEGAGLTLPSLSALSGPIPAPARFRIQGIPGLTMEPTTLFQKRESPHEADGDVFAVEDSEAESLSAYEPMESEPGWLEIFDARVLSKDGPTLIFEFEVPAPGFMLPADFAMVRVLFGGGVVCEAVVLGGESSQRGPHGPGLTVRLALRLQNMHTWEHDEALLLWDIPETGEVRLHIALR